MATTVDHDSAREVLNRAWNNRRSKGHPPARMQQLIEQVLSATDVTFKYIQIIICSVLMGFMVKLF